jgi:aminotransferase
MKELGIKATNFSSSGIREWSIIANKQGAINLSQGYPEFAPSQELKDALSQISQTGPHQYAPNWGASSLREAIAAKQSVKFGFPVNPEREVLVTCGSTEAVMASFLTLFSPGDKVIIFSPFYTSYLADAFMTGVNPIFVRLRPPSFDFDPDELEAAFRQDPKALVLCNPSNPAGKVFTKEELQFIANLAERYDTYVITDEVYEHIVYPPHTHTYFASLPGMFERTISCSSLSKTFSVTGWRLGFVTAPYAIIQEIRKFHDCLTVCAPSPLQTAAVTAMRFPDRYYEELLALYSRKKAIFLDGLDSVGIPHSNPQGAYYVMVDISGFGYPSDVDFCRMLVEKYGLAVVPGSCFFREDECRYVRMHFAKNDETLEEAIRRLQSLKKNFEAAYHERNS